MEEKKVNEIMAIVMQQAKKVVPRLGWDAEDFEKRMRKEHPEWFPEQKDGQNDLPRD